MSCLPCGAFGPRVRFEEDDSMNSEERDVISGIFQRLEQAQTQPRDAEAERFIADKIRAQPYAPTRWRS